MTPVQEIASGLDFLRVSITEYTQAIDGVSTSQSGPFVSHSNSSKGAVFSDDVAEECSDEGFADVFGDGQLRIIIVESNQRGKDAETHVGVEHDTERNGEHVCLFRTIVRNTFIFRASKRVLPTTVG